MWKKIVYLLFVYGISCSRREFSTDRHKHDDDEIEDKYANDENVRKFYTSKKNISRAEAVVEQFVETLMASERYLKMIETVENKLSHVDTMFQERSNSILKYLAEVLRVVKTSPVQKLENALQSLKHDLNVLKDAVSNQDENSNFKVDNTECHLESTLDNRLSFLEKNLKSVMSSVEDIASVISEVKTRQRSHNSNKPELVGNGIDASSLINEFRRVVQEQKSRKCDCKSGRVDRSERYPTDCQEIQAQGFNITGIYKIKPDEVEPFYVLCDLNVAGGGWTVMQNRFDGSQEFYKNWVEYKHGFGNLAGEFWLGLEKIYYLTNQKLYELRVELESQHGQEASATYSVFTLGPEFEGYRISTIGTFRGNAGDSLSYHAGQKFSTYDVDNDDWKDGSCATEHGGAWWYKECDKSNLNGKYLSSPDENNGQSIYWISFKGPSSPLSKTRMMIRPLPASRPMDYNDKARSLSMNQLNEKKHGKETKSAYQEAMRGRVPFRYEDNVHRDGTFFSNYS